MNRRITRRRLSIECKEDACEHIKSTKKAAVVADPSHGSSQGQRSASGMELSELPSTRSDNDGGMVDASAAKYSLPAVKVRGVSYHFNSWHRPDHSLQLELVEEKVSSVSPLLRVPRQRSALDPLCSSPVPVGFGAKSALSPYGVPRLASSGGGKLRG